jgi:hypothetical protein
MRQINKTMTKLQHNCERIELIEVPIKVQNMNPCRHPKGLSHLGALPHVYMIQQDDKITFTLL